MMNKAICKSCGHLVKDHEYTKKRGNFLGYCQNCKGCTGHPKGEIDWHDNEIFDHTIDDIKKLNLGEYHEEAGDYFVAVNNTFIHHLLLKKDKQSIFLVAYDKEGKQITTKYKIVEN